MQEPNENFIQPQFPVDMDTMPLITDDSFLTQMHPNPAAPYVTPLQPFNVLTTPNLDALTQMLTPQMPFNATNTPKLDSLFNNFMSPALPLLESPLSLQLDPFAYFHGTPYMADPLIPSNFTYNWVHQTFDNSAPLIGTPFLGFQPYPGHPPGSLNNLNLDLFPFPNQLNGDLTNGSPFMNYDNALFANTTPHLDNSALRIANLCNSLTPALQNINEENTLDFEPLVPMYDTGFDSLFPQPNNGIAADKASDANLLIEQLVRGTTFDGFMETNPETTNESHVVESKVAPVPRHEEARKEPKRAKLEPRPSKKAREKSSSSDTVVPNAEVDGEDASESKDRRFKCTFPNCNLSFTRLYNMKTHQITHDTNRVRKFPCPTCKRGFDRKHDLTRHIKALHQKEEEENKAGVTTN